MWQVVGDFNNDGYNDVVIVTAQGFAGYTLHRRMGSQVGLWFCSILMVVLVVALAYKISTTVTETPLEKRLGKASNYIFY